MLQAHIRTFSYNSPQILSRSWPWSSCLGQHNSTAFSVEVLVDDWANCSHCPLTQSLLEEITSRRWDAVRYHYIWLKMVYAMKSAGYKQSWLISRDVNLSVEGTVYPIRYVVSKSSRPMKEQEYVFDCSIRQLKLGTRQQADTVDWWRWQYSVTGC